MEKFANRAAGLDTRQAMASHDERHAKEADRHAAEAAIAHVELAQCAMERREAAKELSVKRESSGASTRCGNSSGRKWPWSLRQTTTKSALRSHRHPRPLAC